jgi:hypothetical protein
MELLGVLVLERKAWVGKSMEDRELGESLGAPEVLIYGTGGEDRGRRSWHISQEIWDVERLSQPNRRRVVWDSS